MTDVAPCDLCKNSRTLTSLLSFLNKRESDPVKLSLCFRDYLHIENLCSCASLRKCLSCQSNLGVLRRKLDRISILKIEYKSGLEYIFGEIKRSSFKEVSVLDLYKFPRYILSDLRSLWPRLKSVTCVRSRLSHLRDLLIDSEESLLLWSELEIINVGYNDITDLDDSLSQCLRLKSLYLHHNKLQVIEGIELLGEVEHLFLSYNQLKLVPQFSALTSTNLKSLCMRGNLLDNDLNGLQYLARLESLDLSSNYICKHSSLLVLQELQHLCEIELRGNPVTFHENYRPLTITCLSAASRERRFILDSHCISNIEIEMASKLGQPSLEPIRPSQLECSASTVSSTISTESTVCESVQKTRKKSSRIREVQIIDPEALPDIVPLVLATARKDESHEVEYLKTKKLFEEKRERLGSGWLVLTSSTPANSATEKHFYQQNLPEYPSSVITEDAEEEEEDLEIIQEHEEKDDAAPLSPIVDLYEKTDVLSDEIYDDEEGDDMVGELFLVKLAEDGKDLFVGVGQDRIVERNVLNGKVYNTLDLRALVSAHSHPEVEGIHSVKLIFDTLRKENRERTYRMENEEALKLFLDQMQFVLQGRPPVLILQCQKCSAEFSEDLFQAAGPACPKCKSTIVLQLQSANHNPTPTTADLHISGIFDLNQRHMDSFSVKSLEEEVEQKMGVERCESDITILTNPSQSSIAVVPDHEDADYPQKLMTVLSPCYEKDDDASSNSTSSVLRLEPDSNKSCVGLQHERSSISSTDSGRFVRLDHRIKLYLEMEVFRDNEEVVAVVEGGVVTETDSTERDGLFVATERNLYAFSYKLPKQGEEVLHSIHRESSVSLGSVRHIAIFPNHQGFCVNAPGGFAILLRDARLCKDFLDHLKDAIEVRKRELIEPNMIENVLLSDLPRDSRPANPEEGLATFLLLRCSHQRKGENALQPEAVAVTREFLFALENRYNLASDSPVRFSLLDTQPISNLTTLHIGDDPARLGLHFLDDVMDREICWTLEMADLSTLLSTLKEPWQAIFGVQLLPVVVHECTCGV